MPSRLINAAAPLGAACLGVACLLIAQPGAAADRYHAWLSDGSRLSARAIPSWPIPGVPQRLENRDLLAAGNFVRLVKDRQLVVERKAPYIVFANGDLVAGRPVQLDLERAGLGPAPRVRVQVDPPLMPVEGSSIAVRSDRIRRIVGSSDADRTEPPPGTVELADGRRLVARSIRWKEYGLSLLTTEGVIEAQYGDLVDVVFPGVDVPAAVLDDNLWAGGGQGAAIARFQMTGGSIVTTSRTTRAVERSRRRGRVEDSVYYYAQPSWADEPISLAESQIAWCGYRAANEVPISLLTRETLLSQRLIGSPAPPAVNASAEGGLLASDLHESDLGLLTHSHSEIAFDLPAAARSLEMCVGLDRAVGSGGCVRCKVVAETSDGLVLWDSGFLQGEDGVQRVGPLDVSGLPRVILVTEYAHEGRPDGSDPLDIRDQVTWLQPLVKLDLDAGSGKASQVLALLSGVLDWQLVGDRWKSLQLSSRWNVANNNWDPLVVLPAKGELRFSRKLKVSHQNDVLELRTACPSDLAQHEFTLSVNGQPLGWHTNADRNKLRHDVLSLARSRRREDDDPRTDQLAYWWDLSPWRGQDVALELSLRGQKEKNEIAWRGLAFRSAIRNLPESGEPLRAEVPLTSLPPLELSTLDRHDPLKDAVPEDRDGEPIRFLGQRFTGGYGMRRNSTVKIGLQPEFRKFVAVAGCCHALAGPMQVLIDDRVVWERPTMSSLAPAEQIELEIPPNAKTLSLRTGSEGQPYGYSAWADAGFVR